MINTYWVRLATGLALVLGAQLMTQPSALATEAAKSSPKSPQGLTWYSIAKLPDWSGVWALDLEGHTYAGVESFPAATLERIDPDYASRGLSAAAIGRIRSANQSIPLNSKYREMWSSFGRAGQENLARCLPAGVPGVMLHTIKMEFLFTPGRVTLLTENGEVRRIFTDGRKHSSLDEIGRTYEGESIGHWEGRTLVADTIGFPNGELFQNGALRVTRHAHYVERIRLRDKDHMEIASEMTDPDIFTAPYRVTRVYARLTDPMAEPQCSQSTRDSGFEVELTPPPED